MENPVEHPSRLRNGMAETYKYTTTSVCCTDKEDIEYGTVKTITRKKNE